MKIFIHFIALAVLCGSLAACSSSNKKTDPYQRKKIYLTEQDYLDDLGEQAQLERREAKPNTESDYIFELMPETQKNVYFFDDRTRPMVPGEPGEREYKKTKRLWEKPRRYSPDQYYANQSAADADGGSSDAQADYGAMDDYDY